MTPKTSPFCMSGAHITEQSFRFTTDEDPDHSASWSASATTSGFRDSTTRRMMESETRSMAPSMPSRARLREARTLISPSSSRIRNPLSAWVTSSSASRSSSSSRARSVVPSSRSEKRTRVSSASNRCPAAGRCTSLRGAGSKNSSLAPTRIRSPGPSRQADRRRPLTVMSAPSWAAAL